MMGLSRMKSKIAGSCGLAALVGLTGFALPAAAQSSCSVTVTSLADSGDGSLRNAIAVAVASGANHICFQSGLQGTITLASTLLINGAINITGPNLSASGVPAIVISGNSAVQPIIINAADDSGIGEVVTLTALEITGGNATGNTPLGGGIHVVTGNVTLNSVTLTGNQAEAGGGVYNQGTLTMNSCLVFNNNSTNGLGGGIVNLQGGSLTLQATKVNSNTSNIADGGGIANSGTLVIGGSSISSNYANGPDGGGGLFANGGTTTISGSTFQANAVTSQGADGAGLYNSSSATVSITTSAFVSNVVSSNGPQFGGAIYNTGVLSVSESTFAGNSALTSGGAIYNNTSLDVSTSLILSSVTISTNSSTGGAGGGIENVINEAPSLTLNNTIVAGNTAQSGTADCDGCGQVVGVANTIGGNAGLGPLANNGGPTQTMMPLPGSVVIASGNPYVTQDPQDQRGLSRLTNGELDEGAVQTHYSSVPFYQQPTNAQENQTITPAVEVQVVELDGSTTNYPQGVPVTMELIPTVGMQPEGSLNGTLVQYPVPVANGAIAAVFPDLSVTAAGSWDLVATTYPTTQDGQMSTYSSTSNAFTTTAALTMTQTGLLLSPLQPVYGTPETLTATVTETGTGAPVQAGSVAFTDNGAALSTVSVTNGVATLSRVSLTIGQHVLVASYQGSSTDGASGGGGTFTVVPATPVVTVVTPPAILPGAALTKAVLHATATGVNGVVLPGTVTFSPGLGSVPAAGSLTVTATFTPTDTTDYAAGTGTGTFTVLGPSASGTSLSISPASANPGTAETLTATVAPANGVPGAVGGSISTTGGLGTQTLGLLPTTANFTSGSAISFSVSLQPTAYSADLNGDGVTDQVLISLFSSQIEVLLSDPASPGNFLAQQSLGTYGACYYVSSVAIGDVNGDGLPDLVAACQNIGDGLNDGGPIVLFLNQGNGSFAAPTAIGGQTGQATGPLQGALVALGNFDGDSAGVLDLVSIGANCPNGGGSCFAFQHGNGDGTFNAATYTQIANGTASDTFSNLRTADLNGDGIPDLAFLYGQNGATDIVDWKTNATTPVTFGVNLNGAYLENDDLGFSVGTPPSSLALADLNNDGYADLAVVTAGGDGSGNNVYTFLNSGPNAGTSFFTGTPTANIPYPGALSLGVGDFNQDGHPDLAVYSDTTNLISVLIGDGTGAFPTTWQATVGVTAPTTGEGSIYPVFSVGDANGDGFPDLLIVESSASSNASAKIAVTGGHTQATYATTAPQQTTTYTGTTTPASKYWSGSSGQTALTVTASTVVVSWTPAAFTYGVDVPASDLQATATVNGTAATGTFVYSFTSGALSGSVISTSTVYPAGNYGVKVAFTPSGSTTVYTQTAALTISQATPVVSVASPGTVLPGAVVSLANVHGTATGVGGALLAGTFGYSPALGTALTSGETVTVTFTPTDTTDYVSGVSASARLTVLAAQTTTTTLTPSVNPVLPGVTVGLTAGVTPATGIAGAVPGTEAFSVTSPSTAIGSVKLALDPTTASFNASPVQVYTGSPEYNTYSADFNGDGVADLLAVANGGLPQLLLSVPGLRPSLAAAVPLNLGSTCNYVIGLAVGDVNGDGLPDLAAACVNDQTGATTLVMSLNQGGGNFVPSPTVTTLSPGIDSVQMVLGNFIKTGTQGLVVLTNCYEEGCSPTLDYLQGDGAGNFSLVNYELINNGGTSDSFANLVAGDFNGDGYPDVAFLHSSNASSLGLVEIWTNSGGTQPTFGQVISSSGPTYAASATITAGNGSATLLSLVSADLNLDGKPDLALTTAVTSENGSNAYSSISIALNQSTGGALAFPSATTDTQGNGAVSSIVAADFDGDGVPDLALYDSYNSTVRVLHGTVGQGGSYSFAFTEPNLLFTLNAPSNEPDIVHPHVVGSPRKKATGLKPADSLINGLIYPVLAVGDTNGDGYPDLLVGQVITDQNYNLSYEAQQFVTSGPSVGSTSITAPSGTTGYTAATTPAPNPGYWAPSTGTATLNITSIATSTSLAVSPSAPVYGTAVTLSSQVTNTATGAPATGGSVTFTEDGTAFSTVTIDANGKATSSSLTPPAGQHTFGASYGGATGEGPSTATSDTVRVAKFTPTISWPTPAAITTTTPLSGTQLDASAIGLPGSTLALSGSSVYTPAAGATLPAGAQTLSVTFTPTDTTDYATVSKTVQIQVNLTGTQTAFTITPASPTTYGQTLTLAATVTNTTGTAAVNGGSVTFTSDGVAVGSATVANGAAAVSNVLLTAGTHAIAAAYSGTGSENTSSAGAQTVQVAKAAPTLTWATPAAITTTTPLSAAQLDAAAAGVNGVTGLAGTFVYTPAAGTTLSAGTHTLSVTFTPTDATDYNTATKTVQIQVNATNTQTVLTVAPVSSTYGTGLTLSATVTNTSGTGVVQGGAVTFTSDNVTLSSVAVVNGAASLTGVVLHGGQHVIGASYAGTSGEVGSTAGAQTVQVAKATPTLTWATPAAITTTTPLSSTQLDAAAAGVNGATGLAGTFVYTPAAGTTLSAGTHILSVTFTPADTTDYNDAATVVQIQVNATATRTSLTVTPASSTYGQALTLAATVTNTTGTAPVTGGTVTFTSDTATLGSVTVANGAATLSGVTTLTAGTHTLDASYSPATGETGSTAASRQITVGKATPTLSWATPAAISSTTPLSAEQLDATAAGVGTSGALAGTFVYTPSSGTLTVGTHTLSVTFTPTDAVDYTTATTTVQIQVVNTNTQTTFAVSPGSVTYGQTVTLSAQVVNTSGSAVIGSGSVVFASDNVTLSTVAVVNGAASLSGVSLGGGQHLLTASYTGAAGEGASAAAARTVTIAKAAPVLTWATPAPIASTTLLSGTQLDATAAGVTGAALAGVFTYTPGSGTLTVGTHTLSVSFAPTDAVDYATGTAQVSIQVVPETITLVSISPSTTQLGTTPLPVTVTGSGFPAGSVVQVNGTTLPTTAISATQLGVTVPGADLAKAGTLTLTIYDAASQAISNAATLSVTAQAATAMVSAPATTTSAQQPTVGITLANSYPVDIAGTFTLTFAPAGPDGVDDPAVQFSTGGRTLNFTIPAGTTTGPTATLQSGTVEGTISVATLLTAGGADVTPTDLQTPAAISVAASVPTVTGVTFTNTNGLITVVVTGFSNTREMTEANFIFTGPGAVSLANAGVTVPATSLFESWYTSADSATFGSTFLYTQTFQLSDDTTNITGVAVTLTNTVGTSTSVSSQ
jgi:hypothetical protein